MSEMKYYDMNKCLCKELCCEFEKFEQDPKAETFHGIKELVETMVGLQELEAAGVMREYLEDEHGYNSRTGEFREMMYPRYGIYNAAMPPYYPNPNPAYQPNMTGNRRRMDGRGYDDMDYDIYNRGDRRSRDRDGRNNDDRNMNRERDYRGVYNMAHMKEHLKEMSDHDYDKWIESMEGADGSMGGMWTEEETTSVAKRIGVDFKKFTPKEFQTAMDMMYSDMCEVAEKFNINKPEFYAELAKAWLCDEDTLQGGKKLSAYHEYVVED